MAEYKPSVRIRRIARTLHQWRTSTKQSGTAVAKQCGWSTSKQSRLETAQSPITPADVMTLALVLDVSERERNALFNATQAAQTQGWWEELEEGALVADLLDYVELEAESTEVHTFKIDLIPGLLQTAEYARAISEAGVPHVADEVIRSRVAARMRRQHRLVDENPIRVRAVIAEGALRLPVKSGQVMREQLEHLVSLGTLPTVQIRVLPTEIGAYPAMGLPFTILSFDQGAQEIGYVDLIDKGFYVEDEEDLVAYQQAFDAVWARALSTRESAAQINEILRSER